MDSLPGFSIRDYDTEIKPAFCLLLRGTGRQPHGVSRLLCDFFELSSLDSRQLTLDLRPLALGGLISRVVESYMALDWEKQRIGMALDLPEGLPLVRADVQQV